MSELTVEQYFGKWFKHADADETARENACKLVSTVNRLIQRMQADGVKFPLNPRTNSIVSGETYGGFRPQACTVGAPKSAHKTGEAVDIYDPDGKIDRWLLAHATDLAEFDLYFEHPDDTQGWSHWGTRKPRSGRRFFHP